MIKKNNIVINFIMKKQLYIQQTQYVQRFGEEQMKSNGANENSTNYEMLKMQFG